MVICLERGADLHMAQLMPLPLTVSCFSKIQIGFTFLVPSHLGSHGQRAVKRMYSARQCIQYVKENRATEKAVLGFLHPSGQVQRKNGQTTDRQQGGCELS